MFFKLFTLFAVLAVALAAPKADPQFLSYPPLYDPYSVLASPYLPYSYSLPYAYRYGYGSGYGYGSPYYF